MRTTLTLDDDVRAQIERLLRQQKTNMKDLINDLLRRGLAAAEAPQSKRRRYRTPSADGGRCLIGSIDCTSDALALGEGEGHK